MSVLAAIPAPARPLRVAIEDSDPVRRIGLVSIVMEGGHELVESASDADVILSHGEGVLAEGRPVVALGTIDERFAGALSDDASVAQIDAAIRAVAAGLIVRTANAAVPGFGAMVEESAPLLTPREVEILVAIGNGLSNKAIARKLGISPHTVKFHLESLFRKLAVANRAEAVAKGLARQVIHL